MFGNSSRHLRTRVEVGVFLPTVVIKIGSHLAGYVKYHEFKTVHSVLNKVCGGIAFTVSLFIGGNYAWQAKAVAVLIMCILTSIAAIAEGMAILWNDQE